MCKAKLAVALTGYYHNTVAVLTVTGSFIGLPTAQRDRRALTLQKWRVPPCRGQCPIPSVRVSLAAPLLLLLFFPPSSRIHIIIVSFISVLSISFLSTRPFPLTSRNQPNNPDLKREPKPPLSV